MFAKLPNLSYKAWDARKFCTAQCQRNARVGCFEKGMTPWNKGGKHSAETRAKISQIQIGRKKSEASKEKQRQRMLGRKITWADKISAAHIKQFALFPESRLDIDNGRTLCKPCHKATDNYGPKGRWGNVKNT